MGRDDRTIGADRAPVPFDEQVPPHDEGDAALSAGPTGTSRRSLLTRGAALVAGAVGASVAASTVALGAAPAADGASILTLYVRDVRFRSSGSTSSGSRHVTPRSPHGALVDASGRSVGNFSAGVLDGSSGGLAVQRFDLADGTIIGMGSGGLAGDDYAVVGGTGRFAGATGTYSTQLSAGARGRDAAFRISLTGTKG